MKIQMGQLNITRKIDLSQFIVIELELGQSNVFGEIDMI